MKPGSFEVRELTLSYFGHLSMRIQPTFLRGYL